MYPEQASPTEPEIDPRWKWHYRALMRLAGRFMRDHEQRRRDINASLLESHKDPADTAADESERDIFFAELAMERNSLEEIEAALQRIRRGTYGICEATGKPISPDRLRAIPWTRFCREAAPRGERRKA
jgi:RNA polymerase-binding protein DksA